jgi:hypothetical protein
MSLRIDKFERTVRRRLRQLARQRVENRLETVAKSPALIRGALSPEEHSASTPHVLHDVSAPIMQRCKGPAACHAPPAFLPAPCWRKIRTGPIPLRLSAATAVAHDEHEHVTPNVLDRDHLWLDRAGQVGGFLNERRHLDIFRPRSI